MKLKLNKANKIANQGQKKPEKIHAMNLLIQTYKNEMSSETVASFTLIV